MDCCSGMDDKRHNGGCYGESFNVMTTTVVSNLQAHEILPQQDRDHGAERICLAVPPSYIDPRTMARIRRLGQMSDHLFVAHLSRASRAI